MILSQIAELIAERVERQFDKPFKYKVEDMIVYTRARILTNTLERKPSYKKYFSQAFIVELEEVNKDECEDLADCNCENILRSKQTIPDTMKIGIHPFDLVAGPGGVEAFGYTTFGSERFLSKSPVTGKKTRYTLINDKLYILNNKNLQKARIEGVFSDPRLLKEFKCAGDENTTCYSSTKDFPMDDATTQVVVQSILTNELRFLPQKEKVEIKADKND